MRKGFYERAARPQRIQRYRCERCGRGFSAQTFSPTYWLKHPEHLPTLFGRVLACSAYRQIARELGVHHATVQHQVERLGRHCLLLHERLRPRTPTEPLVLDGFRTLEAGHYWPFDLNLVVGASHFLYAFNDAELRRSGTLTPRQRRRRHALEARHGRPDPRATRRAVTELVARLVPPGAAVELHSDQHRDYPRALRPLTGERRIHHRTTPGRAARTPHNPLFPVNLADLLLRHTGANHKRETIAFSKRRQGALYRAAAFTVWRNYHKPRSERRQDDPPGVAVGAIDHPWSLAEILAERLFPWREGLRGWLADCYYGRIPTRCLPRIRTHRCRYAE